jgi:simple sugar transport system permease protein
MAVFSRLKSLCHMTVIPVAAVILAGMIGAVILAISGADPLQAYAALVKGSFGSLAALGRTLEKATPLIFSGLAVTFAFKAGLFNIGAQGQLIFGALAAAVAGYGVAGLPACIHMPFALLVGIAAGGLYGAIPGLLRAYTGAHEVITCIMLNYIAINITDFMTASLFRDPTPGNIIARTPLILDSCRLPHGKSIPMGFLIALAATVVVWWLLKQTTLGFECRTVGINVHAARYAGMRVKAILVLTMVISGALSGLGGAVETQGVIFRYQPGFNVGIGFEGITIALLGRVHPFGVVPAAILIGAMKAGSSQMQFSANVATEIIDVIQAVILFFIAADMLVRWMFGGRIGKSKKIVLGQGWGS